MDAFLLQQYNLRLSHLAEDILALELSLTAEEATALYALLHVHSHGFSFADVTAHRAALRCIEWGAHHQPQSLSSVLFRSIPAVLNTTPISDAARILLAEQKGFLAVHNGEDWIGVITERAMNDAIRYQLENVSVQYIMGEAPPLIDIDAPITLAKELLRRSACPILIVLETGKSVGYINAEALVERLRPQVLPSDWASGFGPLLSVARQLSAAAEACECQLYLVGGGVRDLFLGVQIKDLDCSIIGDAARLGEHLKNEYGGKISQDTAFSALHWTTPEGVCIDITTARAERYPEREDLPVVFASHLLHDMARRDFSLNAMAVALHGEQWGTLIDAFGGYSDLKARQIRVLHGLSFLHDPLRMLRAARYASRFDLKLVPSTEQKLRLALMLNAGKRLSKERLGNEIQLVFAEARPVEAWALLTEWGCVAKWIPELSTVPNLIAELRGVYAYATEHKDSVALALWLVLSKNLSAGARERLGRLTGPNKDRHRVWNQQGSRFTSVLHLLEAAELVDKPERLGYWGEAFQKTEAPLWASLALHHSDAVEWWRTEGVSIRLMIDGEDLLAEGLPKGPQIGAAIRRAWRQAWMGGDAEAQLNAAMRDEVL